MRVKVKLQIANGEGWTRNSRGVEVSVYEWQVTQCKPAPSFGGYTEMIGNSPCGLEYTEAIFRLVALLGGAVMPQ